MNLSVVQLADRLNAGAAMCAARLGPRFGYAEFQAEHEHWAIPRFVISDHEKRTVVTADQPGVADHGRVHVLGHEHVLVALVPA